MPDLAPGYPAVERSRSAPMLLKAKGSAPTAGRTVGAPRASTTARGAPPARTLRLSKP